MQFGTNLQCSRAGRDPSSEVNVRVGCAGVEGVLVVPIVDLLDHLVDLPMHRVRRGLGWSLGLPLDAERLLYLDHLVRLRLGPVRWQFKRLTKCPEMSETFHKYRPWH